MQKKSKNFIKKHQNARGSSVKKIFKKFEKNRKNKQKWVKFQKNWKKFKKFWKKFSAKKNLKIFAKKRSKNTPKNIKMGSRDPPQTVQKRVLKRGQKPLGSYTVNSGDFGHPGDTWHHKNRFFNFSWWDPLYTSKNDQKRKFLTPKSVRLTPRRPPQTGPFDPP